MKQLFSDPIRHTGTATQVYRLLTRAYAWGDAVSLPLDSRVSLALAAWWHQQTPNRDLAKAISTRLFKEWTGEHDKGANGNKSAYKEFSLDIPFSIYYAHWAANPKTETAVSAARRMIVLSRLLGVDGDKQAPILYDLVLKDTRKWAYDLRNDAYFVETAEFLGDFSALNGKNSMPVHERLGSLNTWYFCIHRQCI